MLQSPSLEKIPRPRPRTHRQRSFCAFSSILWGLALILYTYAVATFVVLGTPPCLCEQLMKTSTRIEYRDEDTCDPIRWALWVKHESGLTKESPDMVSGSQSSSSLVSSSSRSIRDQPLSVSAGVARDGENVPALLGGLKFYGMLIEGARHRLDCAAYLKFFAGVSTQANESELLAKLPKTAQRNGFFVEVGVWNGIEDSNSMFFEKELHWNGILIEGSTPNQIRLTKSRKQRPKASMVFSAVCNKHGGAQMVGEGSSAGLVDTMSAGHRKTYGPNWSRPWGDPYVVQCDTLQRILQEHDVEEVDLMFVDVEGGEVAVLEGMDFRSVRIRVLGIDLGSEENSKSASKARSLLQSNHFCLAAKEGAYEFWTSDPIFQRMHCGWLNFKLEP